MRGRGAAMSNSDAVSIDSVIRAMYETISGAAGQPRQWERDRALHHPKALLIPARQAKGGPAGGVFSFDEFVASRAPFLEANDFYEIEIARREFRFGAIAHVLSFYEARKAPGGELLRRGVNSIQLMHDGERWWVMSVLWDNEREGVRLPDLSSRA
jgi:hypothetical protein